mgnify:CR=1 FL=1
MKYSHYCVIHEYEYSSYNLDNDCPLCNGEEDWAPDPGPDFDPNEKYCPICNDCYWAETCPVCSEEIMADIELSVKQDYSLLKE